MHRSPPLSLRYRWREYIDYVESRTYSLRMRTMIDTLEYLIDNGYCDHKPVGREHLAQVFKKKLVQEL